MSRVLRASAACAAAWLALSGCNPAPAAASRDEVARLPAPGGARLDADSPVTVGGQTVQVELAPGILDPAAPAGGMEYNLRQAGAKR